MRTLVLGAKGQLGRDLVMVFGALGEVRGADLPEFDIADAAVLERLLDDAAPDVIINAAAYTDVEKAEAERDAAFRVNAEAARLVAKAAARRGTPVVYYGTDFVFDGAKGTPYEPDDAVDPHGAYAASKAAGEQATRAAAPNHFIIRTAWLYGPGGNNFVEKILRAAGSRPQLRVVNDEVGSPTHTLDLAEATVALCRTSAFGTYHAVNGGACSRYAFAEAILRLAGVTTPIEPCSSSEFAGKAPRPAYSVLSTEKLRRVTGHVMRPWEAALEHYMIRRRDMA